MNKKWGKKQRNYSEPMRRKPVLERFPFTWFPFTLLRSLILFGVDVYRMIREQVERSIRLQLMLTFAVCLAAAFLTYGISSSFMGQIKKEPVISYAQGEQMIDEQARHLARYLEPITDAELKDRIHSVEIYFPEPEMKEPVIREETQLDNNEGTPTTTAPDSTQDEEQDPTPDNGQNNAENPVDRTEASAPPVPSTPPAPNELTGELPLPGFPWHESAAARPTGALTLEELRAQLSEEGHRNFAQSVQYEYPHLKIRITDLEGNVVFRSGNVSESKIDVHSVIRNAMEARSNYSYQQRDEFSSFYPVTYQNKPSYLIVSGIPDPSISYEYGNSPFSWLSALTVFILLFYYITQKKMRYIEELAGGLRIIATGNLDYRVSDRTKDELGALARDMNRMAEQLQRKIEEERRAEKLKNELITNISHDLRTPLTLIIGYLRLLHDRNYDSPEQAAGYVSIAYNKTEKLKTLIDDLFEYTKLSNQDAPLNRKETAMNDLLEQLLEEYVTIAEEAGLQIARVLPPEKLYAHIDVDKMIRVFDNLLGNAIKYSRKPSVIRLAMNREEPHSVVVSVSNLTHPMTEKELERLFDRFYRVDQARSSDSGGSGLGLSIAKSIVEAHGGTIWAECAQEEVRFYVKLPLAQ